MISIEMPGFEITYKIEKKWLEETFRDLEKDIEVTDKMLEELSGEMEGWIWRVVLENQCYIGCFWEDQNDALYEFIDGIIE